MGGISEAAEDPQREPRTEEGRLQRSLQVSESERCKLVDELKTYRMQREECALQLLAALEELTINAVGNSHIFTALAPDGSTVAVPPLHIEGILEAVRLEFKKQEQFSYTEAAESRALQAQAEGREWRKKFETVSSRQFPIMNEGYPECPSSIPWFIASQYDRQIQRNHGQSLEAIAERGGLDPSELWFVVQAKSYDNNEPNIVEKSIALVKKFNGFDNEWLKLYEESLAHHREAHPECQV